MESTDYNLYSIFIKCCELKSYSKVAEATGLSSHHIVSDKMQILSKQLGVPLFTRHSRGMAPTREAIVLYESVKKALKDIDKAANNAKFDNNAEAKIKIICTTNLASYYLVKPIHTFNKLFPNVQFDITVAKGAEATKVLRNSEADFVLSLVPLEQEEEFQAITFKKFTSTFFASGEFAKKHGIHEKISRDKFNELPYIAIRGFIHKKPIAIIDTHELVFKMVMENHGVSNCLSQFLDMCHPRADVVRFSVEGIPLNTFDLLCVYKESTVNNASKAFMEHISKQEPVVSP